MPIDHKESGHYSEEDDYTRKKVYRQTDKRTNKGLSKKQTDREFQKRRKRSANLTENLVGRNETNKQEFNKNADTKLHLNLNKNNTIFADSYAFVPNRYPTLDPKKFETTTQQFLRRKISTRRSPKKLRFLAANMKPANFYSDSPKSAEIISSEEDFASNIKKRSSRKRSNKTESFRDYGEQDFYGEDTDDGITKSMYDMYYKEFRSSPRKPAFKPHLRSSEEVKVPSRKQRRNRRVNKNGEYLHESSSTKSQRRRKASSAGIPFFIADKRYDREDSEGRHMEFYPDAVETKKETFLKRATGRSRRKPHRDYSYDEEEAGSLEEEMENDEEIRKYTQRQSRRNKRALPEDQAEVSSEPEPEHVVTLRPTQIRTFVVWFEQRKP